MNFGLILLSLLIQAFNLYTYVILAAALVSWLFLPPSSQVVRILRFVTEPVLAPCRALLSRILPYQWRRFDFSPVLAIIAIRLLIFLLSIIVASLGQ